MNSNKLVSIIVPVYNMEKLVKKCIESVLNQTYRDIEIIIVDDGSNDKSGTICDALALTDKRICVVHQDNKGIAGAINTGLACMRGEYLAFVDSDDYVAPQMIERLLTTSIEYNADITQCDRYSFLDENGIDFTDQNDSITVLSSNDEIMSDFLHYRTISRNLAARLFRASLFDDIRCEEGRQVVDVATLPQILIRCSKYVYLSGKYYYVYETPTSVSRGLFTEQRWNDSVYALKFFDKFIHNNYPKYVEYLSFRHVDVAMFAYKAIYKNKNMNNKKDRMRFCVSDFNNYYKEFIKTEYYLDKSWCYKCRVMLFKLCPKIYTVIEICLDLLVYISRKVKSKICKAMQ